ncbi:MAG TPA: hypothetical protein PLP30_05795 [Clostridia bacterium]|nr:hypothetical protein [Clostridia bacterium]HPQ46859.1 hypothetical protein [Clostridia bacterium]HRX41142.1 hypothetical protein [Clostridia bacterium]
MGLTALILGILSVLISIVPFCNYVGLIPAIIGIVLGVVSLTQKDESYNARPLAITGLVFCVIAVIMSIVWSVLLLLPLRYAIL